MPLSMYSVRSYDWNRMSKKNEGSYPSSTIESRCISLIRPLVPSIAHPGEQNQVPGQTFFSLAYSSVPRRASMQSAPGSMTAGTSNSSVTFSSELQTA